MRAVHQQRTGLPSTAVEGRLPARSRWRRGYRGYLVAILSTTMVSALLTTLDQSASLVLVYPVQYLVVLSCALLWGLGPGLLALLLGAVIGQSVFLHPGGPLAPQAPGSLVALGGFLVVGGLVATVAADRRQRREELIAVRLELALVQAELAACESELELRDPTDDGGI